MRTPRLSPLAALALVPVLAVTLAACAAPVPVSVTPAFVDPAMATTTKRPVITCTVHVNSLIDTRAAPETLGVVGGRAVRAPADHDAWLRSVVGGLAQRGIEVRFDKVAPTAADAPRGLSADVVLTTAWVTAVSTNKQADVVLRFKVTRADGQSQTRDYRGAISVGNWASTENELQSLVNRAVGRALDRAAPDLLTFCGG